MGADGGGRPGEHWTSRWASALLCSVVVALVATGPALFGDRSLGPESMLDSDLLYAIGDAPPPPSLSDPSRTVFDLPRDFAVADGFRHGRLDLWNPRVGLGMPLWAEGGAPLLPLKLPFYLAPSRRTYDLATALRLVVAGIGAYLLARRRGLAFLPALAAGCLFEVCGTMIWTLPFGQGAPPCLLPWVLLGAEAIARERRPVAAAGGGVALGVTANSGHPMLALLVFGGFGAAIAGHVLAAWRRPRTALSIAALACGALVLGFALGAPALLPVLDAWSNGRLYKSSWSFALRAGFGLSQTRDTLPIALFAPGLLVPVQREFGAAFPQALGPVVGVLSLFLALVGSVRGGLDAPLVAVALLGVGMTLAPPGLAWVRQLPPLNYVYSWYSWALVSLPLTQAAGRGVAVISTPRARGAAIGALAVILAGALSLLLVNDLNPNTFFQFPARRALVGALGQPGGWLRLALPLVVTIAVAGWIAFAARAGVPARGAGLVAALAVCELLATVPPTSWWRDSTVLASPPSTAVRFLQERLADGRFRMLGVGPSIGHPATPSLFGLPDVRAISGLPAERYVRYLQVIEPLTDWFFMQSPGTVAHHPLLDLGAVRYVVRPGKPEPPLQLRDDPAMQRIYRDERVAIYENPAALPRARIVHAAVAVRDQGEAAAHLTEAARAGPHAAAGGLADRIFVEPTADGHPAPMTPDTIPPPGEDVRIVGDGDPDRIELAASLAAPGWVVLADTFYPGWTATIDGVPTPIHPADLLFRAVHVPAGTHQIVFRYEPRTFRLGMALAALGLAAIGVLFARRTSGPPDRAAAGERSPTGS